MLLESDRPLSAAYDMVMLDLDGVVYVSGHAVEQAPAALAEARERGVRLGFVTNNAARTPQAVAANLTHLGVAAEPGDVVTSAQAAARVLRERLGPGGRVVLLGGEGLEQALAAQQLVAVDPSAEADALVSGYGPDVLWRDIMQAAVRVRDGLWWVASNTDMSIPTAYGTAPGHGVLVDTLRRFSGVEPVVAGKPHRPLLDETIRRLGGRRPLMVGDRLDTDIAGARNAGVDSLLVLTGVTGLAELVAARPGERPDYLAGDLRGLHTVHHPVVDTGEAWTCGGWTASISEDAEDAVQVSGSGASDDWWRAVAACAWTHHDTRGELPGIAGLVPPGR